MSGDIDEDGAQVLTSLDAVGNTTKAITKGIAIATAVLAATALFGSFNKTSVDALAKAGGSGNAGKLTQLSFSLDLSQPNNLVGVIIGASVVFLFSGLAISAVAPGRRRGSSSRCASSSATNPGIMDYTERPDYGRGRRHLHQGLAARAGHPGPAGDPGPDRGRLRARHRRRSAGYLAGAIGAGVLMAVFLANSGGAWDNAKKLVEDGHYGGKGSRGARGDRSSATPSATRSRTPPARPSTR